VNPVLVAVAAALVVALGAIGVVAGEGEEAGEPRRSSGQPERSSGEPVTERVEEIARGVERARELQFERLPRVRVVGAAEARRAGLAELDRYVPVRLQRIEERLMQMLGLVPEGTRLRDVLSKALTSEVAGYYLPRSDTLALVRGVGLDGFLAEVALAHELTHALEDQRFGIAPHGVSGFLRDRAVAEGALHEGTATIAMVDYAVLSQGGGRVEPEDLRGRVLEQLEGVTLPESSGLPRYVRESFVFPYVAGARFVDRIQQEGGWAAVDRAFGRDAPASTEQVMHAEKYEQRERPARVRLRGVRAELPQAARRVARGDIGEFDTGQLLVDANGREAADEAAAGWGGSSFELWRLPEGEYVLVVGWVWDSAADAAEFARAARRSVGRLPGAGAVNGGNEGVTLVVAPSPALARRLAGAIAP
jgi:hypothetical protein